MATQSLVYPNPALTLWKKAGLQFLFLDEERKKALRVSGTRGLNEQATAQAKPESQEKRLPYGQAAHNAHATESRPQALATNSAQVLENPKLAFSDWPKAWQVLRERRKWPPKPLVCWTYAGLGDDLVGKPEENNVDEERKQHVARLIKELNHPGGTHVFWPYALPSSFFVEHGGSFAQAFPEGMNTASFFQAVMDTMRPRVVLIFGSEARDALKLPPTLIPHTDARLNGRLHIQMSRPESFADAAAFARALAFLRKQLEFCKK